MSKLSSTGKAKFAIEFDNGVRLSFIWGSMTYSDNNDMDWYPPTFVSQARELTHMTPEPDRIESSTVEIMAFGNDEFVGWFEDKYGNPAGYVPVNDIPTLMRRAKTFKPSQESK